eukprot:scaffold31_cov263-Pinguiococcus_pyrenoidosus.AAC.53
MAFPWLSIAALPAHHSARGTKHIHYIPERHRRRGLARCSATGTNPRAAAGAAAAALLRWQLRARARHLKRPDLPASKLHHVACSMKRKAGLVSPDVSLVRPTRSVNDLSASR